VGERLKAIGAGELRHNSGRQSKATLAQWKEDEGLALLHHALWCFSHQKLLAPGIWLLSTE
jgi:hypothetical protein